MNEWEVRFIAREKWPEVTAATEVWCIVPRARPEWAKEPGSAMPIGVWEDKIQMERFDLPGSPPFIWIGYGPTTDTILYSEIGPLS